MIYDNNVSDLTNNKKDRKVFKLGIIVFVSVLGLQISRLVASYIKLPNLYLGITFTVVNQAFFMGILPIILYKILISKKNSDLIEDTHLSAKIPPRVALISIVIGFSLAGFSIIASLVSALFLNSVGYQKNIGSGTLYTSDWILLADIIFIAVFPAIFEEIVDRGILLGAIKNVKSIPAQVIILGLFFGFAHQNVPQFFPTFVAGMVIGYVAIVTRSIWPGVIIHFCNNFSAVVLSYISQKMMIKEPMKFLTEGSQGISLSELIWPILAGVILFFALRSIGRMMLKHTSPKVTSLQPEQGHYTLTMGDKSYTVYGMDPEKALHSPAELLKVKNVLEHIIEDAGVIQKKVEVALWEYAPLIVSFLSAAFITLATLIWGIR